MSKITFRADDDLVDELETLEISKSEAMRQALRSYLGHEGTASERRAGRGTANGVTTDDGTQNTQLETAIDELVRERVDDLVEERLTALVGQRLDGQPDPRGPASGNDRRNGGRNGGHVRSRETQDVNVTVSLAGAEFQDAQTRETARVGQTDAQTHEAGSSRDARSVADGPAQNGGTRSTPQQTDPQPQPEATQSSCGQCGETVEDDHVYCPNCGEKSSRRLFCECGDEFRSDWSFCPGCGRRTPAADVLESR